MDKMDFSTWLTFVFIPRVRGIIEEKRDFPTNSMVGSQAVREAVDRGLQPIRGRQREQNRPDARR
jgi:uncharacterized protein YqcC (DUF446 family)